ncbi:MAG: hypothetical protein RI894_2293 [Bacteroidota bacterium]|jgi:hypothetical protein
MMKMGILFSLPIAKHALCLAGRPVQKSILQTTLVAGANKWSVRDLPQGVYVVRIFRAAGTVQTAKFTIAR